MLATIYFEIFQPLQIIKGSKEKSEENSRSEEKCLFILLLYVDANKPSLDNSVFGRNFVCPTGWKYLLRWSWRFSNQEAPPSWLASTSSELSFLNRTLRSNFCFLSYSFWPSRSTCVETVFRMLSNFTFIFLSLFSFSPSWKSKTGSDWSTSGTVSGWL